MLNFISVYAYVYASSDAFNVFQDEEKIINQKLVECFLS